MTSRSFSIRRLVGLALFLALVLGGWSLARHVSELHARSNLIESLIEKDSDVITFNRQLSWLEISRARAVLSHESRQLTYLEQQIATNQQLLAMRREQLRPEIEKQIQQENQAAAPSPDAK